MTNPLPLPPAKPPRVIDGKRHLYCRVCQQYHGTREHFGEGDRCNACRLTNLREIATLPQASHKKNAVRRRMKP